MADNNNYCLDRVAAYLLKQRVIGVEYIRRVALASRTTTGLRGHLLATLLDYMSPVDRELIAKLATGQIELSDLDGDKISELIAMGLLDDDGHWNTFVWAWATSHGFCAIGCPEQWLAELAEYQAWTRYCLDEIYLDNQTI